MLNTNEETKIEASKEGEPSNLGDSVLTHLPFFSFFFAFFFFAIILPLLFFPFLFVFTLCFPFFFRMSTGHVLTSKTFFKPAIYIYIFS